MYLIKPTSCKFLNFFLALYSFVFNRSTCVKNMKNIGRIVLPIIILLLTVRINAVPVKAFDMIVRNLPNSEQLPTKELLCIFQDSEGYMWYGTEGGGLCRDDGYMVKVFRSDFKNPGILENNSVTCITEDGEGKIWFGTKRGAYILSKTDYEIRALADETIKSWTITTMTATSDGTIWISTNRHLFRYNESGERTGKYILKWKGRENTVNSIYEDKKQTVWVTQAKGGLFCYDKVKDSFISYPWPYDEYPTSMTEDHNTPYYWVTTWGKGIVRFDPKAQDTDKMFGLQTVDNASSNSDARKLHHIIQDSVKGYLWVTAADNLYAYKITADASLDKVDLSRLLSADRKILTKILSDQSGNLWVTGYYPSSFIISFLPNEVLPLSMEGVKQNLGVIASPMQFSQEKNYYWIRQKKLGLYAYDPQRDRMSVVKNDRELSFFFERPSDREGIYMVRDHSVILIRYKEDRLFESIVCTIPIKQGERIRALHDDRRGNLWIGTTYHLFRYSLEEGRLTTVCDDVGFINAIVSSNEGVVYFATESRGLWRISGESRLQIKDTGENYSVLTVAPDNNLLVGTKQGNVYSYSPDTNDFISRTKDCGLTGDAVLDIKSDDDGNLWILTSQRVMVYHPGTHIFTMMSCTDSWINLEDFQSLYKDPRGEMSVGGRGGIVTFPHYNEKKRRIPEPTVHLTSVEMNNTSEIGVDNQKKISLSPHERNVKLFFSTFDHLNTDKVRYAYRYKQRNDNWVALPAGENSIGLSDLSKGEFELEVRVTDENGLWSKSTLTVMIQCLPAWYETGWAYLFYVLVVLSVVWGLGRMYMKLRKSIVAQTVLPLEQNPEQRHEIDPLSEEGKVEANSISASDEQLIRKALDMVEKNLSNPEYSIEDLSRDMCMSRATLYRKITSITGSSPSDFVKNVRLRKAAELLKEGGLTIAEIADKVGFNTPSYFTKSFKKLFGVLPTQYK